MVSCKRGWSGVREDLQVLTLPFISNNKDLFNFKFPVPKSTVVQPICPGELREFPQTHYNTLIVSDHQNDFSVLFTGAGTNKQVSLRISHLTGLTGCLFTSGTKYALFTVTVKLTTQSVAQSVHFHSSIVTST